MNNLVEREPLTSFKTFPGAVRYLKKEGFTAEFIALENKVQNIRTRRNYLPENLEMIDILQFEVFTDLDDDVSMIYLLQADDGVKGWLCDTFGPYTNPHLKTILPKIKMRF